MPVGPRQGRILLPHLLRRVAALAILSAMGIALLAPLTARSALADPPAPPEPLLVGPAAPRSALERGTLAARTSDAGLSLTAVIAVAGSAERLGGVPPSKPPTVSMEATLFSVAPATAAGPVAAPAPEPGPGDDTITGEASWYCHQVGTCPAGYGPDDAFVALPGPTLDESGPVEVWQTEGRADWEKIGELPDPSDAYVHRAAYGGGRWLALGVGAGTRAWSSTDGVHWKHAPSPGDQGVNAIVGWAGGLIAAGSTGAEPGETCGGDEPYVGRTWLSTGADWQALPPTEGAAITALVIVGDRIVGIGQAIRADGGVDPVQWTATLATLPAQPTPAPTPTPSPTPRNGDGCGS